MIVQLQSYPARFNVDAILTLRYSDGLQATAGGICPEHSAPGVAFLTPVAGSPLACPMPAIHSDYWYAIRGGHVPVTIF